MPISNLDKLHYSFCQDLGDKAITEGEWPEKINFALFKIKQRMDGGFSGRLAPGTEVFIPGFYEVQKVEQNFWSSLTEKEYQTFIAPSDYNTEELLYKREKQLIIPIPNEIFQHPHLPIHSTFQFYFLNNSLFTANLDYLDIGDFENNGSRQLRVDWKVRSAPSGTYVFFRSGHIFFKWKIEVRQGIVNMSLVKTLVDGVSKAMSAAKQAVGSFFGINTSGLDEAQKEMAKDMVGRDKGKDFMERERSQRIQEQHTARMFQSTLSHTGDQAIEPAIFYANTVSFPYNLFDYWLRNIEVNPFTYRFYYSNNLLNNLKHNNNENPITYPLNITFEKLGNILKPGFYQGKLTLDHDPEGRMTECFARGITFYNDKKEHFINPDLGVKEAINVVRYGGDNTNSYVAQAIQSGDEPWTNETNRVKRSNYHQRAHFFITYEDGSKEHWCVKFPLGFQDSHLAEGHAHGGFDIKFDKPVKEFIDVYACIGCGAPGKKGETAAEELNRDIPGYGFQHDLDYSGDSLDSIIKGIPYHPWFERFTNATLTGGQYIHSASGLDLGGQNDVWEFTGEYIRGKDNKPFTEAYGFIPQGGVIKWVAKGGGTRIEWQEIPNHDNFSSLDWTPPAGSGGETEIPLSYPEVNVPEPGENEHTPDLNLPEPDLLDPTGGEPEIPPVEIDTTIDTDIPQDQDNTQDFDPPPIEIDPPEIDPGQDQDNTQDQDTGNYDVPPPDPFDPDDDDAD